MLKSLILRSHSTLDLSKAGRFLFAIALAGFGVEHLLFGEFISGRAPLWPSAVPGKIVFASLTGLLLIVTSFSVLLNARRSIVLLIISAVTVLVWAFFRNVLSGNFALGAEITLTGKSLALFGSLLITAAIVPASQMSRSPLWINNQKVFIIVGRYCISFFLIICGIQHFVFVPFVAQLVPSWIPGQIFWTYFSGVALIAGGLGLLIDKTVQLTAALAGIMILIWFIILHIPRALNSPQELAPNEWIAVCESLAFSAALFTLTDSDLQRGA